MFQNQEEGNKKGNVIGPCKYCEDFGFNCKWAEKPVEDFEQRGDITFNIYFQSLAAMLRINCIGVRAEPETPIRRLVQKSR